jgi:hypothetical protein
MGLYGLVNGTEVAVTESVPITSTSFVQRARTTHLFNNLSGVVLDILWDDQVFYVEKVRGEFVVVEGCTSAFYTRLSPVELIKLGSELIVAGTVALRETTKA